MSFSSTPSEGGCSRLRARFAIDGQALDAISPLTAVVRPAYGRLAKHQGINQASSHEPVTAHGWQRVLVPSSIRLSTLHVVLLQSASVPVWGDFIQVHTSWPGAFSQRG